MKQATGAADAPAEHEGRLGLIARLQGAIDATVGPVLGPKGAAHALIDFPDHPNVGDSAIWVGEMAYLRRALGRPLAHTATQDVDWALLDKVADGGTVLVHGGGNFGDVWPAHQEFREAVLRRYPATRIVQMPQSIHYADPAAVDRTARAIAGHKAFTLLVRDHESLDLATARFDCDVRLCPDMAFCMGPQRRLVAPTLEVLLLLRIDHEARSQGAAPADLPAGWVIADWLDDGPSFESSVKLRTRLRKLRHGELPLITNARNRSHYLDVRAERRVTRGLAMLSQARFIVTDRLHVHILATLLGVPHVILDNSYGKIRRFSTAFGTTWDGMAAAATIDEAIEIARDAAGKVGAQRAVV